MKKEEQLLKKLLYVLGICLFLGFIVFGVDAAIRKVSTPEPKINIENSLVIIANDEITFNTPLVVNVNYADKINEATKASWGSYNAETVDWLVDEIISAAIRNNLKISEGFSICHVESDFKINAHNKTGDAWGVTQVTPVCLREYNEVHSTTYTIEDMLDPALNLEVGFWYYNRILTHYDKYYGYITRTSEFTKMRDAYIAYNVGVTMFHNIGRWGRNQLRNGVYPIDMYGSKAGESYEPVNRCFQKMDVWM